MARLVLCFAVVGLFGVPTATQSADVAPLLARIKSVGKEGKGNVDAAQAWRELVKEGPDALLVILGGLDDAKPLAANWLRSAVDAIAERTVQAGKPLPAAKLEAFVRDTKHKGSGRRLAYEWLLKADASASDRLLPGMLDDPGAELRRDAVDVVLKDAQKAFAGDDKPAATALFKKALAAARDVDQVKLIAERLRKLDVEVDLTAHLGFITRWMIAGPFDNSGSKGFHVVYPPEKGVDLKATYRGKDKKEIRWQEHVSKAPLALVDLNKVLGKESGVIGYGYAVVTSDMEQPVEIRCGSNNAVRLFLNGKEIYFREEYHHGMEMDQHAGPGILKAGRNEILVKICQNEQKEDWAQLWSFQLRVCDALGAAVPLTLVEPK